MGRLLCALGLALLIGGCGQSPLLSKDPNTAFMVQRVEQKVDSLRVEVRALRAELRAAR